MLRASKWPLRAALAATLAVFCGSPSHGQESTGETPRPPRQPRISPTTSSRGRSTPARRQNPLDIPLPPRPPRDRPTTFLVKLRGAGIAPAAQRGAKVVQNGGYPELHVDGAPFFVHSAEFPYPRIPRDLWEVALDHHRDLGINTIALTIPWNWHEPQQAATDFEGRSNPRRDLRSLLRLITEKEFKLIVRLGTRDFDDWPYDGFPEWLLTGPEFKIPQRDLILVRRWPLLLRRIADTESGGAAVALDMLARARIAAARQWLPQVFGELSPYAARATTRIPLPPGKRNDPTEKEISGPLLFIQVESGTALSPEDTALASAALDGYLKEFRGAMRSAGLDGPLLVVSALDPTRGGGSAHGLPALGRWFFSPPPAPTYASSRAITIPREKLDAIEAMAGVLSTQPEFPPMLIEYQAGGQAPVDEPRPVESPPVNTLLSTRLTLAHGLRGLNHFPLMDGITPAGHEVPGVNRYYRWDAALNVDAYAQPRARAVSRTGNLLETWDRWLAGSHKRADFGLLARPGEGDMARRLLRASQAAGLACELLDASGQPAQRMMHHALLVVAVTNAPGRAALSEATQHALVDYVQRGGTVAFFPERPAGQFLQPLWSGTAEEPGASAMATAVRRIGKGKVIEAIGAAGTSLLESGAATTAEALKEFVYRSGARPVVERTGPAAETPLAVTQLVTNAGSGMLGERNGGSGLLSVTNLDDTEATQQLQILPASRGARDTAATRVALNVIVPAGESLLLPMGFSLCSAARAGDKCSDEIIAASAELLRVERDGKVLEMTFYVPAKATLLLRLAEQPSRVRVDETGPEGTWATTSRTFEVEILRGAAPDYLRVVKVHLPYTPHVAEKPDRTKPERRDFDFAVTDAARLPLAADASLRSYPPLIVLKDDLTGRFIVEVQNYDRMGRDVDIKVEGPVTASEGMGLEGGELRHDRVNVRPANDSRGANNGAGSQAEPAMPAQLEVRSGRDTRRSPITFLGVGKEGVAPYRFDFDRDGSEEWVLEDDYLRLVLSPESGGRLIAVIDKDSGLSLTNAVGMLRDSLRGSDLSQAAYTASWLKEDKSTALRLEHSPPGSSTGIEKIVRITGNHEFEITYRVRAAAPTESAVGNASAEAPFAMSASVPVVMHSERTTRFCWPRTPEEPPSDAKTQEGLHCETFEPGERIEVPAGISALQVRTPGSFAQRLEWHGGGQMFVEMKQYTAMLQLRFAQWPAGDPAEFKVKYSMVVVE